MSSRFLNNITINDEYTLPTADGSANQVIATNGNGVLTFVNQSSALSGGEANKVAVWSATDTLTHNDNFHFDTTNVRLGIGDSNPNRTLVVSETRTGSTASDAYTAIVKSVQSSGASPNPGTGGLKVQYTSSSSNVHAFGLVAGSSSSDFLTTGPMHFYTNSDLDTVSATGFAMVLDTSQRLGIGLTNPSQKLTVSGNVMAGRYYSTGTTVYYLDPSDTTTSAYVAGPVRIRQSSSYQSTALEVTTATGSTGDDGVFIKNYWAGGPPTVSSKNPFLSIGCADSNGHKSTIYLGEDASPANQESKIEYAHDSADLRISVKGQGTYREHVRFGDAGSTTARTQFTGNVGIGTAPSAALHVSGVSRATSGFSTDGNNRFYTWRALNNTASSSNQYYRIARVTGGQSTRFIIELAGRSTSYGDGVLPAFGKIVGQLNNDNNFDIVYYNASATDEVVDEVGQVDVSTVSTDIYVRVGQYAELTATAHISDGTIATYDSNSGSTSAPTNYVQATEYKLWNTGNDGTGSGLDADLLDGQQGSYYLNYNNFTNTPTIPTDFVSAANGGTFSGNIVVSKSSGDAKLIIEADTDNNNENDNPVLELKQDGGAILSQFGINGDSGNTFTGAGVNYAYWKTSGGMDIVTNGTTRALTIDASQRAFFHGNVGIGTTSPAHEFHVIGTGQASDDFRAQLFYDSNNTAYYLNPNGTSQLGNLNVAGTFRFQRSSTSQTGQDDNVTVTVGDSNIYFTHNNDDDGDASGYDFRYTSGGSAVNILTFASNHANFTTPYVRCTNNSSDYAQLESNSSGGVLKAVSDGNTNVLFRSYGDSYTLNNFGIGTSSPGHALDVSGTGKASNDFRAPIYYDSDNTGFYFQPESTSNTSWRLQTPTGYLKIGSRNSSYVHFYTDRGQYYFDKGLTVDTGAIRSYNEDLNLNRAGSTTARIRITSGVTYSDQYLQASGSLRAPVFYDSNNTAYYVNPGGTSKLYQITTFGHAISSGQVAMFADKTSYSSGAGFTNMTYRKLNSTLSYTPETVVSFQWNTSQKGSIGMNAYGTQFNTSSDYRLKENGVLLTDGIQRVKQLQPKRFNFIGFADQTLDGFFAHEVSSIVPEAVTGEKDAVDENNNPIHQSIDQSKIVPLLTAALKEAIAKIEDLETRVQSLEN